MLKGRDCHDGLTGRDGLPEPPGAPGRVGMNGQKGDKGEKGEPGMLGRPEPPGAVNGGAVYTRLEKTSCANISGTSLVYSGHVGRTHYTHKGNYQWLPNSPEYAENIPGVQGNSYVLEFEYETHAGGPLYSFRGHNVQCAVCHVSTRAAVLMIPARVTCPTEGITFTTLPHTNVLDKNSESVPGSHVSSK